MTEIAMKIKQIQLIEKGKGLSYILNEAFKIMGNPSVLHDMEYKLISCAQNVVTDDILWNELVDDGGFSAETIDFFMAEEFIDIVASTQKTAMLRSDKLKYDRLYGRVLNSDNSTVLDLVLVACFKPITQSDMILFEALTERLSQEISADSYFQRYGVIYHDGLICRLLEGNTEDRIINSGHISNLYEGLKANLFVAVADMREGFVKHGRLEDIRDMFKKAKPEFKYAVYSHYIVILISAEEETADFGEEMEELHALFDLYNMDVGISGSFDNLFEIKKYYNEAVESLKRTLSAS